MFCCCWQVNESFCCVVFIIPSRVVLLLTLTVNHSTSSQWVIWFVVLFLFDQVWHWVSSPSVTPSLIRLHKTCIGFSLLWAYLQKVHWKWHIYKLLMDLIFLVFLFIFVLLNSVYTVLPLSQGYIPDSEWAELRNTTFLKLSTKSHILNDI